MSPLESATDYFLGIDAEQFRATLGPFREAIVARALAHERQRSRSRSNGGTAAAPAKPRWQLGPPAREAKPRWRLSEEPEHVEVRSKSASPVTISLGGRPWETLHGFVRESRDGKETAGFLFADHVSSFSRPVSVRWVTRAVKDRAERSAALDIGALVAEKAELRKSGDADRIGEVGSWHTHPTGGGRPSPADLAHWLNSRDFLDRGFYIGLILTAHGSDTRWNKPTVHAWIVRRTGPLNRPVCEPACVSRTEKE